MKPAERDDLLIRIDVRTENIEKVTTLQEKHLARLNGSVQQLEIDNASVKTTLYGKGDDKGMAGQVNSNSKRSRRNWIILVSLVTILGSTGVLEWTDIIHIFGG